MCKTAEGRGRLVGCPVLLAWGFASSVALAGGHWMDGQWCEDDEEENGPGSRCDGHFLAKEQDWRLMSRIISISFPQHPDDIRKDQTARRNTGSSG